MTEKDAREFLKSYFFATQKIKALELEKIQLRIDAQGGAVSYEGNYPSMKKNGVESNLIRLAAREQEIDEEIAQLKFKCKRVRDIIGRLEDDDLESVLINRYITYHTIEETAEIMNYAPRTVRKKQKQAYKKLCLIMP
ncbi:hypothetical protein [Ruminococcus sp.]|uniref:hypothetical protein n=1 Tax=Ruminococcus sp. TaxID=41978 RepID=UPI001B79197D|nr:hypothetical protein [Ruminococcus sp.]MBP5431566.1 hypothetical protein [Ruminococcus sp.]